jgi:hypothetical protein
MQKDMMETLLNNVKDLEKRYDWLTNREENA